MCYPVQYYGKNSQNVSLHIKQFIPLEVNQLKAHRLSSCVQDQVSMQPKFSKYYIQQSKKQIWCFDTYSFTS